MAGILIIGVYCLFWWFCWKFSGLFGQLNSKVKKVRRIAIFLIIAAVPYYINIYESALYKKACDDIEVYFPKKKFDTPQVLVTNSKAYNNSVGEFDGNFDYLLSPLGAGEIDLEIGISQFSEYILYPYETRDLPNGKNIKQQILNNVRFGFFLEEEKVARYITIYSTFIYDFKDKKKISSFSSVIYSTGQTHSNIEYYLWPVSIDSCQYQNNKFSNFDFSTLTLFKRTFKSWKNEDEKK